MAFNEVGTTYGADQSFTTLPPCKGVEGECEWSTQTTPNPTPKTENELSDVACPSSSVCLAAGSDEYQGNGMLQVWEGSEWRIANNTMNGSVSALACGSTSSCMIVGSNGSEATSWKAGQNFPGGSWSASPKALAVPEGVSQLTLRDISCVSTTACTAVGSYYKSSEYKALVESWNGTSWSLQTVPNPPEGSGQKAMLSISCSSSTSCVAVGEAASKPVAETWNGTSWTSAMAQNPSGATAAGLEGVSCGSSTACTAVGYSKESGKPKKALAEFWNGTSWSIQATPNPSAEGNVTLRSVSCTSGGVCNAVGEYAIKVINGTPQDSETLTERWNGASWLIMSSPNPKAFNTLSGLSCSSSSACTAVGSARPELGVEGKVTLALRRSGSEWSTQTTPNPTPKTENELSDVACPSSSVCLAAGSDEYQGNGMLQVWEGSEWRIANNTMNGSVSALACGSTSSCMIVGSNGSEATSWKAGQNFPGGSWSASPKALAVPEGASQLTLRDISCVSTTACTAVGSYYKSSEYKALVESWNGTSWSLQTVPNPPEGSGQKAMLSISCSSSTSCVAVGEAASKPVAETWNGTSWTSAMAQNPSGATAAGLEGVSCGSSTACTAVGYSKESGKPKKALAEFWNGTSWSIQSIPNPGEGEVNLRSVSCLSASSCTAVGSYVSKWNSKSFVEEERKTLSENWNGSAWSIQASPSPKLFSLFNAVSCSASTACTAVGSARPESGNEGKVTLGVRYE